MFHWYSMTKFSQKKYSGSGEKVDFVILLFLVMAAILDIRPDPVL